MNNKMKFKNAFTLAEILIVITIIGIVVSMLLPLAKHVIPDKEVMKFKKANNAFVSAIRELANSDKYFTPGDFGLKKDGSLVSDPKQFCNALADVLSAKSVNCSDVGSPNLDSTVLANILPSQATFVNDGSIGVRIYEQADCMCRTNDDSVAEIITSDGVTIYTVNPKWHFGSKIPGSEKRLFNLCSEQERYKYYCIDIDGIGEGEDPFGYAVRADGKVFLGSRAQAWMERDIQQDEDGYTNPYSITTCSNTSLSAIEPEEDSFDGCKPFPCGDEKIMAKIEIDGEDYCITKYNMGKEASFASLPSDSYSKLELPENLNLDVGINNTCPSQDSKCCWGEDTQTSYGARPNNNSYKTVCTFNAAKEICSKYAYLEKDWKLPTNEQISEIIEQSIVDLNFCSNDSNNDSYCSDTQLCYENYGSNWCSPSRTWAVGSSDDTIAYLAGYQTTSLGNYVWQASSLGSAVSVRCIAKVDSHREVIDPCDGADCGNLAECVPLSENRAVCMTKYNIGPDAYNALGTTEAKELDLVTTYTTYGLINLSQSCIATCGQDDKCCWTYNTGEMLSYAGDASNYASNYPMMNRTVCSYPAADQMCSELSYKGKTWRLPTSTEIQSAFETYNGLSKKTSNNLMLCDSSPNDLYMSGGSYYTESYYCKPTTDCALNADSICAINALWLKDVGAYSPGYQANYMASLQEGSWSSSLSRVNNGASVRCISDDLN